jgi:hypothetical protein
MRFALLGLSLIGCSKIGGDEARGAAASAPAAPIAAVSAATAASIASAASPERLASFEVCLLVVRAGIAEECERKPSPFASADAAQFTMAGTPARNVDLFGGVFTFATPAAFEEARGTFKSTDVGKDREPAFIFVSERARTVVGGRRRGPRRRRRPRPGDRRRAPLSGEVA